MKNIILLALLVFVSNGVILYAATELKLNPNLNYNTDSNDGPLITGKVMSAANISTEKPTHIIFYHRECYNSKRQAKRTVELYEKFKDKVNFIVVDLEEIKNSDQVKLKSKYYTGYIPHVTILTKSGKVIYDRAGEVSTDKLSSILQMDIDS